MNYDTGQASLNDALAESASHVALANMTIAQAAPGLFGNDYVLNSVREFITSIVYLTDEMADAFAALLSVTHVVDAFTTVPRGLVVSNDPASGKTTLAIDVPAMLAFNGWAADATEYALKAKYSEPQRVTLLLDEISKIFGESGLNGRNNKIYKILAEGYRNTATLSMAVNRVATDVSSYGVAFMAGLKTAVPSDLRTRSVVFNMKQIPTGIELADSLDPSVQAEGFALRDALHAWSVLHADEMTEFALNGLRRVHPKLTGRKRQIWGPLFAVAASAGGTWPARMLAAFQTMALDASEKPVLTVPQQLLLDTADILVKRGLDQIFTYDLIPLLRAIPERDAYRSMSDEYLVRKALSAALGKPEGIRGTNLSGAYVLDKGRRAAGILARAAALHRALYPPPPVGEIDPTEDELTPHPVIPPQA